jgi:ankyrin repeat protein
MLAVKNRDILAIEYLLKNPKCDPNIVNKEKNTALWIALNVKYTEGEKFLFYF